MYAALTALLIGLATTLSGSADTSHASNDLAHELSPVLPGLVAPAPEPIDDPDDPLAWAVKDYAAYTGADPDDVNVVLNQNVTWPDGSLGCPQPDRMYIPVQVSGYLIVLQVEDNVATYHGAQGQLPFRCEPSDGTIGDLDD